MKPVIVQRDVVKSGVGFGSALAMVTRVRIYLIHDRGAKMAMISKENDRHRQHVCL
jgi:hypothetical protein